MNLSLKLAYHKVYVSAAWCKRSLLYDQTIEDKNIFSPAFLVELRGWLNLPGGSTYPTLPYILKFVGTCKPTIMSFVPTKYLKYQQNIE